MNNFLVKILSYRWMMHLLFWTIVIADGYLGNERYMTADVLYRHLFISVSIHIVQVYSNILFLYPKLFERGKIWQYIICLLLSAMFFAGIGNLLYLDADILKHTPYRYFFFRQLYVQGLSTGAKFLRSGIYNYFRMKQLQREQKEAELKLLQSQVNPHFLFNTLNNLYSLTLKNSPQAPETVLKLSELMRYMTSVTGVNSIALKKEIEYLENYVALERLRLNHDALIDLQVQGDFSTHSIAPLMLIPFVENAFKHGVETQNDNIHLEINISLQGNELYFYVSNTKPTHAKEGHPEHGTGLKNVIKRLELIYPAKHQLTIREDDNKFFVKLLLQL